MITRDDKIRKVIKEFFYRDPVLLDVMNMVDRKYTDKVNTVGLDYKNYSVPTLNINPDFIDSLDEKQLEIVFATELLKVLLKHPGRSKLFGFNKMISVLSSQITINGTNEIKTRLEKYAKDVKYALPEHFKYPDEKAFEYYSKRLEEDLPKDEVQMTGDSDSKDSENKEQDGKGSGKSDNKGENKEQDGKGNGSPMDQYYDPSDQTYSQNWGENELFDAEVEDYIDKNKDNIKQWGKYTGNFIDEIIASNKANVNYNTLLRSFRATILKCDKEVSRKKINRRYGIKFPGYKYNRKPKILFSIDISGSMSSDDISEALGTMNEIFKNSVIDCATFDTTIKSVEPIKKMQRTVEVKGRGGTDFNEIVDYANKNKYDGHIIFTDGFAPKPKSFIKSKTVFLINNDDLSVDKWANAKVIHFTPSHR